MTETEKLYDKTGRQIMLGDVLKVFHFIGARRKRYHMYKHVVGTVMLGRDDPKPYLSISHLDQKQDTYLVRLDGSVLWDYEIVQGYGDDGTPYEDRPKNTQKLQKLQQQT